MNQMKTDGWFSNYTLKGEKYGWEVFLLPWRLLMWFRFISRGKKETEVLVSLYLYDASPLIVDQLRLILFLIWEYYTIVI